MCVEGEEGALELLGREDALGEEVALRVVEAEGDALAPCAGEDGNTGGGGGGGGCPPPPPMLPPPPPPSPCPSGEAEVQAVGGGRGGE